MSRGLSLGVLSGFTVAQWGMVTAAQARAVGVSRADVNRLVADRAMEMVPGGARVYRLAGAPVDPDRDPIRAVWLQLGDGEEASARLRVPDAVVAGRSAALVLGVGDLAASVHEFYVTRRRQLRRGDVRLRLRSGLPSSHWLVVDGLPVCTVARVVADLLGEREDGEAIARICQDAVDAGLLDAAQLREAVAADAGAYGATSPEAFVDQLLGRSSSRSA
jgi:hypothetical protein